MDNCAEEVGANSEEQVYILAVVEEVEKPVAVDEVQCSTLAPQVVV